jgi:uncharacterized protein YejL (UPF0352 family)
MNTSKFSDEKKEEIANLLANDLGIPKKECLQMLMENEKDYCEVMDKIAGIIAKTAKYPRYTLRLLGTLVKTLLDFVHANDQREALYVINSFFTDEFEKMSALQTALKEVKH